VVGATGYAGQELLRLLAGHPRVEVGVVTSGREAGRRLDEIFPHLTGVPELVLQAPRTEQLLECELVFFATPHGVAMHHVPELLAGGRRIIDLSADFRLRSPEAWQRWYGCEHACPEILAGSIYGLPEFYRRQVTGATLVANPGCYPTATLLALMPLLQAGVIAAEGIIVDAKSGVSGAGRTPKPELLYAETAESFKAYAVDGHRHLPEILQILAEATADTPRLTFVPHLAPMTRGLLATCYARCRGAGEEAAQVLSTHYAGEPFVEVMAPGMLPDTAGCRGSNVCRIAVHQPTPGGPLVVLAAIDNLQKGAAGQAVQNMNLMFGFAETEGLARQPLLP